jgi:hypothetical protein
MGPQTSASSVLFFPNQRVGSMAQALYVPNMYTFEFRQLFVRKYYLLAWKALLKIRHLELGNSLSRAPENGNNLCLCIEDVV